MNDRKLYIESKNNNFIYVSRFIYVLKKMIP